GLNLLCDEAWRHGMNTCYPLRVLCGQCCQDGHAIGSSGRKSLQIGLNSSTTGWVGACNGQDICDHWRALLISRQRLELAILGSVVPQIADTTASPLAPAAKTLST